MEFALVIAVISFFVSVRVMRPKEHCIENTKKRFNEKHDIFFLRGFKNLVGIKMERPTSHSFRWANLFFTYLFINDLHASNSVSTSRYIVGYLLGFRTRNA